MIDYRDTSEIEALTENAIYRILTKRENEKVNVTIFVKRLNDYFPVTYTREQMEEVIYGLLDRWRQENEQGD
ncbi:hypothetical protein DXA98_14635 [Lachnospiraceae bacterium OF09-6]|nr:hypothetical protein DXA98_14635 [Lachnospiraceae bacterium OF09-6]